MKEIDILLSKTIQWIDNETCQLPEAMRDVPGLKEWLETNANHIEEMERIERELNESIRKEALAKLTHQEKVILGLIK